jgi:hypothetical protein
MVNTFSAFRVAFGGLDELGEAVGDALSLSGPAVLVIQFLSSQQQHFDRHRGLP